MFQLFEYLFTNTLRNCRNKRIIFTFSAFRFCTCCMAIRFKSLSECLVDSATRSFLSWFYEIWLLSNNVSYWRTVASGGLWSRWCFGWWLQKTMVEVKSFNYYLLPSVWCFCLKRTYGEWSLNNQNQVSTNFSPKQEEWNSVRPFSAYL